MAGQRFRDGKPVFNRLGLPVICTEDAPYAILRSYFNSVVGGDLELVIDDEPENLSPGWFEAREYRLQATSISTSNAVAELNSSGTIWPTSTEISFSVALAYDDVRYVVIDLIDLDGTGVKSSWIDLLDHTFVSTAAGVTGSVESGDIDGYLYRLTMTTGSAIGPNPGVKLYLSTSPSTKTFAGLVGAGVIVGAASNLPVNPYHATVQWESSAEPECCGGCAPWRQCLDRLQIQLDLSGVVVEPWLRMLPANGAALNRHGSDMVLAGDWGGDRAIFAGTYLCQPGAFAGGPLDILYPTFWERSFGTTSGYLDEEVPDLIKAITAHASYGYRSTSLPYGQVDRAGERIHAIVTTHCDHSEGTTTLRFVVWLYLAIETGNSSCDPPSEPQRNPLMWPYLISAPIDVTDGDLSLIADIPLSPYDSTLYDDDGGTTITGDPTTYFGSQLYDPRAQPWDILCSNPYGPDPEIEPVYPCNYLCWFDDADDKAAAPKPVVVEGENTLSLVRTDCRSPLNCETCPPEDPPNPGKALDPVEVDFSVSGSGCYKTLTIIVPDCIDVVEVYWSTGQTGAVIGTGIWNRDEETGLVPTDDITAVALDARGCVYVVTKTITCACPCPGVTGSLSITTRGPTEPGDPYYAVISAAISVPEGCFPFIELCELESFNQYQNCDECVDTETTHCMAECVTLGPDEEWETIVDVESPITVRCFIWRLWDGVCGCPSAWQKFSLPVGYTDDCGNEIIV